MDNRSLPCFLAHCVCVRLCVCVVYVCVCVWSMDVGVCVWSVCVSVCCRRSVSGMISDTNLKPVVVLFELKGSVLSIYIQLLVVLSYQIESP